MLSYKQPNIPTCIKLTVIAKNKTTPKSKTVEQQLNSTCAYA